MSGFSQQARRDLQFVTSVSDQRLETIKEFMTQHPAFANECVRRLEQTLAGFTRWPEDAEQLERWLLAQWAALGVEMTVLSLARMVEEKAGGPDAPQP